MEQNASIFGVLFRLARVRALSSFKTGKNIIYQSFPLSTSFFFWHHRPWWNLASSKIVLKHPASNFRSFSTDYLLPTP